MLNWHSYLCTFMAWSNAYQWWNQNLLHVKEFFGWYEIIILKTLLQAAMFLMLDIGPWIQPHTVFDHKLDIVFILSWWDNWRKGGFFFAICHRNTISILVHDSVLVHMATRYYIRSSFHYFAWQEWTHLQSILSSWVMLLKPFAF